MEEAVVGGVVGATIQVGLQNLLLAPVEEISRLWNFKEDVEKLKESIYTIQDLIEDAEMKQVTDKGVKRWLMKLEAVVFNADNVFDELNYEVLREKVETENKIKKEVTSSFFSNSNPIIFRPNMAQKIKDINEELELINQDLSKYGLKARLAGVHAPCPGAGADAPTGIETDSFSKDRVFGRDRDVSRIVGMLTASKTEEGFSVLPIVGMGGLGKTTLARKVCKDDKIISHFGEPIWVHVSRNFDPEILFKKILELLTKMDFNLRSREAVLKKLRECLEKRRYLLVLDDVWNEETNKWDDFIDSLAGIFPANGNCIIVTTRSGGVASIVKTLDIHELKGLSQQDCLSIIKAKTFGKVDRIPSEFGSMGENIARRCQGLPLAAKVVGGLLRGKSEDDWRSIDFGGDGNIISKVLKLSFDHLSSPSLRKCFAYCSVIPKGYSYDREEMIQLWMAEGLCQTYDQRNDMEAAGERVFNRLLQNSLFQVLERDDYGNITRCNMHDHVHDLACSVSGSQVRYIWYESTGDQSSPIPKEKAKCLRSLYFKGKVFDDDMFLSFKCLHVLALIGDDVNVLPSSISKLLSLRYLDISLTRITHLPDSVGELYHLQTLRAVTQKKWKKNYLIKLPNTLKYLISLRHLHIADIELPPEIGRLTSLQTLPYFKVGDEEGRGIGELGSLKNLKGELEIHNLENVNDKEEAKSADLFHKPNIFKLTFVWNESRSSETNDENVLDGLQPHPNLKSLEICGFKGKKFPSWTSKNLMEIRLTNCEECEEIPMLGHLSHLKSLYLYGLTNVRSIDSSFYGIDDHRSNHEVFPKLERLELSGMPNLTKWTEVELQGAAHKVGVFPRLEYLKIGRCRQLDSAPTHFPCLKELEIHEVDSGSPLASICGIKLTTLTKMNIRKLNGLECLPDQLFCNNRNLSELEIRDCPNLLHLVPCFEGGGASLRKLWIHDCSNLRELADDLHILTALEELRIGWCPNLRSIPYPIGGQSSGGLASLCQLDIEDCQGLTNLPGEMLESCAPSLEKLSLRGLNSLMNMPLVISFLQKMPRLTELTIVEVPKFTIIASKIGSIRCLRRLHIGRSLDSLDYVSFKENFDGFFQVLQSLRGLTLYGMEEWDALPDQLQYLTALDHLYLSGFGIEALPEWLGNLSSLNMLSLFKCQKLRRFPSKEAILRLTKLTCLYIRLCPLLEPRCLEQQSDDSEWPKISHIPRIYVSGNRVSSAHGQ